MNHYKATIARLEASRLKLIQDSIELRAELEKTQKQLKRTKARVAKMRAAIIIPSAEREV